MKTLIAALALAGLSAPLLAAPKAESAQECGIAADMAIVARSLAEEEVHQPKAETIMARIYDVRGSERGQQLMKEIVTAAYKNGQERTSQAFAEDLFTTCMKTGGNMDKVLGRRL